MTPGALAFIGLSVAIAFLIGVVLGWRAVFGMAVAWVLFEAYHTIKLADKKRSRRRRAADRLRAEADRAWMQGDRDSAEALHMAARRARQQARR